MVVFWIVFGVLVIIWLGFVLGLVFYKYFLPPEPTPPPQSFSKRTIRLAPPPQFAKLSNNRSAVRYLQPKVTEQMPVPNTLGPHYTKSLRILLSGPLGIAERKDVVRYRALQAMGLVDGVGVRCVSLTKAGRNLLKTGVLVQATPTPASFTLNDEPISMPSITVEFPF